MTPRAGHSAYMVGWEDGAMGKEMLGASEDAKFTEVYRCGYRDGTTARYRASQKAVRVCFKPAVRQVQNKATDA